MQLAKEILFPALQDLKVCLHMTALMLENMEVRDGILNHEKYKYLFTVEAMNDLVNKGVPYRDACREIGNSVDAGTFAYDATQLHHTHEGSIGNLCLEEIRAANGRGVGEVCLRGFSAPVLHSSNHHPSQPASSCQHYHL